MATRRTGLSRSRPQTAQSMPPPSGPSRPRSVIAKPSSSRSGLTTPVEDTLDSSTVPTLPPNIAQNAHSRSQLGQSQNREDTESNIQVVMRCRRRSDREVQENSPIIVTTSGARSQSVTIETASPSTGLGVITLPPTRTYPFDAVFGPEADQAMIYQEVVSPMLDEVLMGYNCTLFAYGQTGTGKTYTMQGDLGTTPMGNPNAQAGMIPRVLFRLFHQLEDSSADYSVKISYVELYNEELRDLLASELAAPSGSVQPMGMGSRDSNPPPGSLKIFDDATKKGVVIQGLEETAVMDAPDALALLVKGSHRRQIAATKFNDHSSRSHSVFSITVHMKETSSMGEDLLRVGKMNLVDLAGSENIGRSGAENKRAREAGMINQSLLTLGRVINALVEKSSHIPYRESKLTRLLQDSLGGRTKTCIIATISPARSNMEETLSTLDYAMRAKSIRNRPEVNQRLTRNALLKEYVAEIEHLKADLLAAREKNGIFFAEETWNQMSREQELARTEMEEAKRQVEIVGAQMRALREEFEECMKLLTERDGELRETKGRLIETQGLLGVREGELRATKGELDVEVMVRTAFQDSENNLNAVALGLKKAAEEGRLDIEGLFAKLGRKSSVFDANTKAVFAQSKLLTAETQTFTTELDKFFKSTSQITSQLSASTQQYQVKELESLESYSERIAEQVQRVQEALQTVQAKDEVSAEAIAEVQSAVKEAHDSVRNGFMSWSEKFRLSNASLCAQVENTSLHGCQLVEKALKGMSSLIDNIIREAQDHIESEHKASEEAQLLTSTAAHEEIRRLQEQNAYLVRLLETEKVKSERSKDELIKRISGMLGDYANERDRSLREAVADISEGNQRGEEVMRQFGEEHAKKIGSIATRGEVWSVELGKKGGDGKRLRDGGLKSLSSVNTTVKDGLTNVQNSFSTSMSNYASDIQKHMHSLNVTTSDALERHGRAKRARVEATNALGVDVQSGSRQTQRTIAATSRNIESSTSHVVAETSKLLSSIESHFQFSTERLSTFREVSHNLVEQGARDDQPTGKTPRKRTHDYVTQWELTKPRDILVREWKTDNRPRSASESTPRAPTVLDRIPIPSLEDLENAPLPVSESMEPELEFQFEPQRVRQRSISSYGREGSNSVASSSSSSKVKLELNIEHPVVPKEEEAELDEHLLSSSNPSLGSSTASDRSEAVAPLPTIPAVESTRAPSVPALTKMRTRTISMAKSGLPMTTNHLASRGTRRVR